MSTAMQALERMLLSQERREQTRVQESLSMMQMAQTSALQQRQLAMQEQKQNNQNTQRNSNRCMVKWLIM